MTSTACFLSFMETRGKQILKSRVMNAKEMRRGKRKREEGRIRKSNRG
jgi:hypothetical protein